MTYGILGLAYLILIGVFLLLSALNFYHLIRFGMWTRFPIVMTVAFFAFVIILLVGTWTLLSDVDWSQSIEVSIPTPSISPDDLRNANPFR